MELQTVTITRTETFLVWANFARPDLEVTQRDAEILLGYMAGHDYELVLQNGELFRHDVAEQPGEMQEYDIDDVIDIVCEWNYELKTDARHGMEDPKDFIDFCNYKDAFDALSADCENLDRLFARTKYGRVNEKLVEQIVAKESMNEKTNSQCEQAHTGRNGPKKDLLQSNILPDNFADISEGMKEPGKGRAR